MLTKVGIFSGWIPENQSVKCMKTGVFCQGLLQQDMLLFSEHGKLSLEINES